MNTENQKTKVYGKSSLMTDATMNYCPGCSHGVVNKLIGQAIESMDIQEQTIGVSPVGCAAFMFDFIDIDWSAAPHGRASAVACGIKRVSPEKHVFCYQGDGDLAAIGTSEVLHSCNRGDNITIILINNGIYGMTGGQMSPTTLEGMATSTTPAGRNIELNGYPLRITELIAQLPGTCYVTRQAVHTPSAVRKTYKAITKAFELTAQKKGNAFIEVVSSCNSGWKMTPTQANEWMATNFFPFYPLGDLKSI